MELLLKKISKYYGKNCRLVSKFDTGNYGETYRVNLDLEDYVMKIIPKVEKSSLNQMLPFLHFINNENVMVPHPLKAIDGHWYYETDYKNKPVYIYIYPLLTGENLEDTVEESIDRGRIKELGIELASLHNAMNCYPREKLSSLNMWYETDGLFMIFEEVHKDISNDILIAYEKSIEQLKQFDLAYDQVIHNDMHMANILYHKATKQFKFIDLEDSVIGNRIMDIAILCFDLQVIGGTQERISKGVADLISGYETLLPLNEAERDIIPVMLKVLEIASYINFYVYKDQNDPWLKKFFDGREEKIINPMNA